MTKKELKVLDQGMYQALDKIKAYNEQGKDGVAELTEEIRRRGITGVPITVTRDAHEKMISLISKNLQNTMIVLFFTILEEEFGFNKKEDFQLINDKFNEYVTQIISFDKFGEHYVTLNDFAVELKEKYGLYVEDDRISYCQKVSDDYESGYHHARIESIIELLEQNGHPASALFLRKRFGVS